MYHLEIDHIESLKSILGTSIYLNSLRIGHGKANLILKSTFEFKAILNEEEILLFVGNGYCEICNQEQINISS